MLKHRTLLKITAAMTVLVAGLPFSVHANEPMPVVATFSILGDMVQRICLLYTSPSPRDRTRSRMPSSA